MKTNSSDRRAQRTVRLVTEALVALMVERRYDTITVQDILDRANVGRSRFYTHFHLFDALVAGSQDALSAGGNGRGFPAVGVARFTRGAGRGF